MSLDPASPAPDAPKLPRIEAIDVARGVALIAMATYHFTWDLEFFGYVEPGLTAHGGWKLFACCIASSFLFLVGISLWLAHGRGIRWRGFLIRFAMVAGAALAISLVTYFAVPDAFIFFGILHQIAAASLLGLLFLRLPVPVTLVVAAAVIAAPFYVRSALFDHPWLWWLGLSPEDPRSNDYVPIFPWFGAVLVGIAAAKLAAWAGLLERLARVKAPRLGLLQLAGRHSLAFYLIHQPVLIGCVWLFAQIFPAATASPEVQFRQSCEAQCSDFRDEEFCTRYCVCMLDALEANGSANDVFSDSLTAAERAQLQGLANECTERTDKIMSEGGIIMADIAKRPSSFPWPPLVYVAAIVISIFLWILYPLPWFGSPLSDILFAVGWIVVVAVVAIDISAMRTLSRAGTTIMPNKASEHLVTSGAFSFTRNPIYLANTLLMIGVAMISGIAWFILLAVIAAFITQKLAIEGEEKHLEARFGKKYFDYKKRVRRWV